MIKRGMIFHNKVCEFIAISNEEENKNAQCKITFSKNSQKDIGEVHTFSFFQFLWYGIKLGFHPENENTENTKL